jgi:hypothetical protein
MGSESVGQPMKNVSIGLLVKNAPLTTSPGFVETVLHARSASVVFGAAFA